MNSNTVEYDFQFGERYSYQVFSANDIELEAEERAGLYSWHMRLLPIGNKTDNLKAFCSVMSSKSFDISLRSNLRDRFDGQAEKKPLEIGVEYETNSILSRATAILCPPIYIGISNNIKSRLSCHKKALTSFFDKRSHYLNSLDGNDDLVEVEDSDEESSKFGERVGKVLARAGMETESALFIKAIYLDGKSREEIRQCESFVNRNFHPLFGLR